MFLSSNYADGLEIKIAELSAENAALRKQLAAVDDAAMTAELAVEATNLRRQLDECREDAPKHLLAENTRLRNAAQLFEEQLSRTEDERDALRRQLAECQAQRDTARDDYRRAISQRETLDRQLLMERVARKYAEAEAAVSPALIEEYAQACCHDAGVHGFVTIDWPQWLRKRQQEEVQP